MNSRSVSDNLVNFSTDLGATLNQPDSKEPLLSFPFDHLYACSTSGERRQTLHLNEVEISTHCVLPQEKQLNQRLASLENQNKKLKDLLIYHLDLIQQQNELVTKKEKTVQALKQENDTLKSKVSRAGVGQTVSRHHGPLRAPATAPTTAPATSGYKPSLPSTSSQRIPYKGYDNFFFEDPNSAPVSYLYNPNLSPNKTLDPYALDRPSDTVAVDLPNLFGHELNVPSLLEVAPLPDEPAATFTMIENKRPKRQPKSAESREPKYPVTTSTGSTKAARTRKKSAGVGSSRTAKGKAAASAAAAAALPKGEKNSIYDDDLFNLNADSKVSFGKYTALQERLQLIEPTPTGEDPYQIGEAEMREQSPIPKLMLQKTQGRLRVCHSTAPPAQVTATVTNTSNTRRNYDTSNTKASSSKKRIKMSTVDPFASTICHVKCERDASLDEDQELDVDNSDCELDWSTVFGNEKKGNETSLCDFSYGETSTNLANLSMDINNMEFPDFFEPGPVSAGCSGVAETAPAPQAAAKTKKRRARTTSLAGPLNEDKSAEPKRNTASKRGRKRAHSTAAPMKRTETPQAQQPPAKRGRRAVRGKKEVVPGKTTNKEYDTCMGDPDVSWYCGLDPDIKKDDCDTTDNNTANVEVPSWRIKEYSPRSLSSGSEFILDEDLDDKVYEKRHQKFEIEERRQQRWHLRRLREQRHLEHLRQRQRDRNSLQNQPRGDYSIWPRPIRDIEYIEITDVLPVNAFGQELPDIPDLKFVVPWVKTPKASKASRRSMRSKTLH